MECGPFLIRECIVGSGESAKKTASTSRWPVIRSESAGSYRSLSRGERTFPTNIKSEAPNSARLLLASDKLKLPFGPPRTILASESLCPSSFQRQTGHISKPPLSCKVRNPQHGHGRAMAVMLSHYSRPLSVVVNSDHKLYRFRYSQRRAMIGSTLVARRAGSQAAAIVMEHTTSDARRKVTGSVALTWNS